MNWKYFWKVVAVAYSIVGVLYLIFSHGQIDEIHGLLYIVGSGVAYGLSLLERILEILESNED